MGELVTTIHYSPVCDIAVLIICVTLIANMSDSIIYDKRESFNLFRYAIICLIVAIISKLCFETLYKNYFNEIPRFTYYLLNDISIIAYIYQLSTYTKYLYSLLDINGRNIVNILNIGGLLVGIVLTVTGPFTGLGMYITEDYTLYRHSSCVDTFAFVHIYFVILIANLLVYNRKSIMEMLYMNLITTMCICIIIIATSSITGTQSLLSVTFLIPLLTVITNVYSNQFDIVAGAYNYQTFIDDVKTYNKKGTDFTIISITFINLSDETLLEMKAKLFNFYAGYIKHGKLYKLNNNRYTLTFKKKYNEATEIAIKSITGVLKLIANSYMADYKIVAIRDANCIRYQSEYFSIIDYFERRENNCDIHCIDSKDIETFREDNIIINEVQHISHEGLLDTNIVKAYYQPIYNTKEKRFKTAEALMRMEIPGIGFIYPDKFIKVAEDAGIIHTLSLIMLNKVCIEIKKLINDGYDIDRISVNFSIIELREESFLNDIKSIIDYNGIPYNKIAIEITESRNDNDFDLVRSKISELKAMGMNIYLDDFGTGYSNIERIMRLPLDTIKFDRSMLLLLHESADYKYLVRAMTRIFSDLKYTILFEGVETDIDEITCTDMNVEYLQGYKYSKPIPIDDLRKFLHKVQQ